jgi:hypothetical protein
MGARRGAEASSVRGSSGPPNKAASPPRPVPVHRKTPSRVAVASASARFVSSPGVHPADYFTRCRSQGGTSPSTSPRYLLQGTWHRPVSTVHWPRWRTRRCLAPPCCTSLLRQLSGRYFSKVPSPRYLAPPCRHRLLGLVGGPEGAWHRPVGTASLASLADPKVPATSLLAGTCLLQKVPGTSLLGSTSLLGTSLLAAPPCWQGA